MEKKFLPPPWKYFALFSSIWALSQLVLTEFIKKTSKKYQPTAVFVGTPGGGGAAPHSPPPLKESSKDRWLSTEEPGFFDCLQLLWYKIAISKQV